MWPRTLLMPVPGRFVCGLGGTTLAPGRIRLQGGVSEVSEGESGCPLRHRARHHEEDWLAQALASQRAVGLVTDPDSSARCGSTHHIVKRQPSAIAIPVFPRSLAGAPSDRLRVRPRRALPQRLTLARRAEIATEFPLPAQE